MNNPRKLYCKKVHIKGAKNEIDKVKEEDTHVMVSSVLDIVFIHCCWIRYCKKSIHKRFILLDALNSYFSNKYFYFGLINSKVGGVYIQYVTT